MQTLLAALRRCLPAAAFAACAVAAFLSRSSAAAFRSVPAETQFDVPPFPAEISRPFSFGLRSVVADLAFMGALQNYGGQRAVRTAMAGAAEDRALNRLLTYATDLDPKFAGAYRFAGNAMPRHTSDGKATNVLQAEILLRQGVLERGDDWRIPFLLGFIQSFYLGNFREAGRNLALASRAPGAPAYLGLLATRASAAAGDVDFAEDMARTMLEQTTEESTQAEWHKRLADLQMERHLRAIEAAAQRYIQREGKPPSTIAEIVRSGDLPSVPHEPHGGRYVLGPGGEARSTAAERLRIAGRYGTMAGLEVQ
jgi:hypothetical protein